LITRRLIEEAGATEMLVRLSTGFSVDTAVWIASNDSAGLERLVGQGQVESDAFSTL